MPRSIVEVAAPVRAKTFAYDHVDIDAGAGTITCRYHSDEVSFVEVARFEGTVDLDAPGVHRAAELYFVLAGLSYYKTGAAATIDLGEMYSESNAQIVTAGVSGGLAEFAYRNGLDLSDINVVGAPVADRGRDVVALTRGPLIPFGGGIDSIVTVATLRDDDAALFVVGPRSDRFAAIERPAAVTGLEVVRCSRELDTQLFEARRRGWFDGHVPVTAMLSSLAVIGALGQRRRAVVMSNERSASVPNLVVDTRGVNHQWSKSWECEQLQRSWLAAAFNEGVEYYSALRDRSELWVAREFAQRPEYFDAFMSCNRAFRQDPSTRATTWCGECDKCLFIDLVLAPFVDRTALERLFSGCEPLGDPRRSHDLEVLVGLADNPKPFECVGDIDECATALVAAAARADRAGQRNLAELAARCVGARPLAELLVPDGPTNAQERNAARDLL